MLKKRKIKDIIANLFTFISTFLSLFILGLIVVYIIKTGGRTISLDILKGDYWGKNVNINFQMKNGSDYTLDSNELSDLNFSKKFGFAVSDQQTSSGDKQLIVKYIDDQSPLHTGISTTAGEDKDKPVDVPIGADIKKITYINLAGEKKTSGVLAGQNAETMVKILDQDAQEIESCYYQVSGGGIFGSLKTTLMLIGLSLLFALPLGIFSAIYLHEIAKKNKLTSMMRSSIEMLNGVPSIIFGLMGITMLFPLTKLFGMQGPSILLGALTMAVILLPLIIRQTEEALIVLPDSLRMGSLSLGATQMQTIFKVILPNTLPSILSATLLSVSRVIGESAALIYTMGTFINDQPKISDGATSLAVQIWLVMSGEQPNFKLATAISLIILIVVLTLNILIKILSHNLRKKWSV